MGCCSSGPCDTASNGAPTHRWALPVTYTTIRPVVSRQNSQERKYCHFLRRYQKIKKKKDFRVLGKARPEKPKSLFFFGTLQENASFWWKTLPFHEEVPNKTKKSKILESWRRRGLKSPKSLFFLVFFGTLQENASFWWKTLPFHEEVPNKTKKSKILESWRRRGLKSPKSLFFFVFFGTAPGKFKLFVENVAIL